MLPMPSTMSDFQLTIGSIFEHGVNVHAGEQSCYVDGFAHKTPTGRSRRSLTPANARRKRLFQAI